MSRAKQTLDKQDIEQLLEQLSRDDLLNLIKQILVQAYDELVSQHYSKKRK